MLVLAITAAVSLVSRLVFVNIFIMVSARVSKQIRYDLYYCYFKKCAKKKGEIDKTKSMKLFQYAKLLNDIEVLADHLKIYLPQKSRCILLILACISAGF
jgi:ABC-type transport system involved in cytochrome bd biosynthesis fused ATPase/permease subunit